MQLGHEARDYASYDNAVKALDKALARIGRTRGSVRWMIIAHENGRLTPAVHATSKDMLDLIPLAHIGVVVIG